jgi:hypothetical protein
MERQMSLFDMLTNKAEELAGKVGIPPEQVLAIASTIEAKTGDGSSQLAAIEAAAAEHGLPVEKIQELMEHAGGATSMMGSLGGMASGFLKKD